MSISPQKSCFSFALFSALCISCHLKISPLLSLNISSDHSKIYAVAEDSIFQNAGLNPPWQPCQGCVYSSLHSSSERHSALRHLRMPLQAKGTGANAATYAQLSKQPVPAPSRDLSNWSGTSQLGTADRAPDWDGLAVLAPATRREKLSCEKQQNSTNSSGITQGMVVSCLYLHL